MKLNEMKEDLAWVHGALCALMLTCEDSGKMEILDRIDELLLSVGRRLDGEDDV